MATPKSSTAESDAAWLPLSEAAAIAGVSVRAMQKRAASGKIGARKIDIGAATRWEVDARELDANQDANCEPIGREPGANFGASKREPGREPRTIGREPDANREPIGRELSPDREAELKSEIAFLRGIVESDRRDMAELRAALREALKLAPKQLTAGAVQLDGAASGADVGGVAASNGATLAPEREPFDGSDNATAKRAGAAALTYNDIADQLERDFKARGPEKSL